jgi:Domain of unknown function (DUF6484)
MSQTSIDVEPDPAEFAELPSLVTTRYRLRCAKLRRIPMKPKARFGRKLGPRRTSPLRLRSAGVVVGLLAGFNEAGEPLVTHPLLDARIRARAAIALERDQVGCEVVIAFNDGHVSEPIVLGLFQGPRANSTKQPETRIPGAADNARAESSGERLVLSAQKEIVLKCGGASITLTRAGKILIRGTYLVSRSSGANRIMGGVVQIN